MTIQELFMIRQTILGIGLGTFVLTSGLMTFSASAQSSLTPTQTIQSSPSSRVKQSAKTVNIAGLEQSVFKQINQYRRSIGLQPLQIDSRMTNQAKRHSQDMANAKVPFGHDGFHDRVKAIAIPYSGAAENVAFNQGYSDPATQAVQGWLKSPGHLTNIKGNYNLTGIGVATNSKGEIYFTQVFLKSR